MSTAQVERTPRGAWAGRVGMGLLALGAVGCFPLARDAWFVQTELGTMGVTGAAVTGGLAETLPTAALAGLLLMLVFGAKGRRIVGVVAAALAAMALVSALGAVAPDEFDVPLARGGGAGGKPSHTPQWTLYLVTAGTMLLGALLVALRPGKDRRRRPRDENAWVVLDRGEDPTVG